MSDFVIFGRNPIAEALAAEVPLRRLLLAQGVTGADINAFVQQAKARKIPLQNVPRLELDRLAKTTSIPGLVAADG